MTANTYREYVGNLHVHSVYSDGTATVPRLAAAAAKAGLNFVIITDHNVRPEGLEGYRGQVLVLMGEEVHNVRAQPQANHLLVYGTGQEMSPYSFGSTQTLIQTVARRGGVSYIAHPIEKSSPRRPLGRDLAAIPWTVWPPDGIRGIELWNYMSEFKGLLWSRLVAPFYALWPSIGIKGPYRATLRLWDELLAQGYQISAIGGADAHGRTYALGPFHKKIFPYTYLFQCVNTHVLTKTSLTGSLEEDRASVYEALRAGRTWVGYDLPHSTRGFRLQAQSGAATAVAGEELKRLGALVIQVILPARAEIRLLRDGRTVQRLVGHELKYTSEEAGVYRVEVYRRFRGHRVGWIFTSPIYVT